ncbi:MAG TPA: PQQ-dependent sugar dehydrogenase [Ilumatobacter sp.]|nr:PQQ-dependent sugar dehydrogenase [Ilumatobacter sp.]
MRRIRLFTAAFLTASSVVSTSGTGTVSAAAVVPVGFTATDLAQLDQPTAAEWLPNNQLAVLQQDGQLLLGHSAGWTFTTALDLDVCSNSERGLLGLAPDPGFLGTGFIYLYYTRPAPSAPGGCVNRVSRFTLINNSVDPATEVVLLDNISSVNGNHNGGDLEFGSDGYLYVGVGDAGRDPRNNSGSAGGNDAAQDLSLLNGKVLRVTTSGAPAPGNPFLGEGTVACATRGNTPATPTSTCQEIWAYGLRNPYRFAFDHESGQFFINDVGQGDYEEVNVGQAGGNYGWPIREGACPQGDSPPCAGPTGGLIDPVTAYGRDLGTYITGGAAVPNGVWPTEYDGVYLFADGGTGRIWARQQNGEVDYDQPFATQLSGITDMTFGYDGTGRSVLYTVSVKGTLGVIRPSTPLTELPNTQMTYEALPPYRAFDTGDGTGGALTGKVVAGTTRAVDAGLPIAGEAALVNITMADTAGPGFVRVWATESARPVTSNLNADTAEAFVANTAIVPLDDQGRFLIETNTAARIVVDVMGVFHETSGPATGGRFNAVGPTRLVDTRLPAGPNQPTAENQFSIAADGTVNVGSFFRDGALPTDDVGAVVLSIAAIGTANSPGGFAGAYPGGGEYAGTSNVNVLAGDVRANMVVVPFDESGRVKVHTLNLDDVVVDLLGYFTSDDAPASTSGLFSFVTPTRMVDTRLPQGFPRLSADGTGTVSAVDFTSDGTLVQNVAVTGTSAPGFVAVFPGGTDYDGTSTVNFTGRLQTRAALTFGKVGAPGTVNYRALVDTDLVVDAVGVFSA